MVELVQVVLAAGVAVLRLSQPPVNALGQPLRAALRAAVADAEANPAVRAVVIAGAGRNFAAAADLRDLERPEPAPTLADLCAAVEACRKPVVAALHGTVLAGALELALAAHWRVASAGVRLGFPDIALALMPGGGGTQRLPRLVGAAQALRILLSGALVAAGEALELGLIDGMAEGDATEAAVLLAQTCGVRPTLQRAGRMADAAAYLAAVAAARRAATGAVAGRIVDAVEAALLLPADAGLAFERAAFEDCRAAPDGAGLRHAFLAERRLARVPEATVAPRGIDLVGVVGAGQIGSAVALAVVAAGLSCVIVEKDRPALMAALQAMAEAQERAVQAGAMTPEARDAAWARLGGAANLGALAGCDLVIEAVPEDRALKASVLGQVAAVLRPGAVIAVTSAGLPLAELARVTRRAGDVIGLGFPAPLPEARLIEVGVCGAAEPAAVATGFALVRRLGRVALRVRADGPGGRAPGLLAGRMVAVAQAAAEVVVQRGVGADVVRAALAGIGLGWAAPEAAAPGRGAAMADPEIRARVVSAMVNAGAAMVAEGAVQRPSDVDVLSILTLGLPRVTGGVMCMADRGGMLALRRDLRAFAADSPDLWEPQPLVLELFRDGRRFGDLNG